MGIEKLGIIGIMAAGILFFVRERRSFIAKSGERLEAVEDRLGVLETKVATGNDKVIHLLGEQLDALKECTIEFDTFELDSDNTFTTIKDAWINDTSIELKALSSATGSGPHGYFSVTGFTRNEALEEAVKYSVTCKLTQWIDWATGTTSG